ncbi:hypothetical protein FTO70_13345 [Methanosarcina sp. KYL-1]|uniref:hypothetical protein n=1 Tax=Methanosarcina sp. KYL-1 TaxID=2602068 RepID=UPI002100FCA4|nr:hypothetical protein [Methanosarcina sp. KYL-1]MCQ1536635.1 hypothetical protein [Methanosarcina sp. KYL-1]
MDDIVKTSNNLFSFFHREKRAGFMLLRKQNPVKNDFSPYFLQFFLLFLLNSYNISDALMVIEILNQVFVNDPAVS